VALTITFDLEDNRRAPSQEERFVAMTDRFLEFAAARGIRATVFAVGELARSHPRLIHRVAAGGHEIALHGLRHVPLGEVGPGRLREQLREGRALLEDAAQSPVQGFRAPIFSLTPRTAWAIEDLTACGFAYSSSVLPAASPLHGWPGAPRTPFRWSSGLAELPCPVAGAGRARIPFLGGVYMRYVPSALAARLLRRLPDDVVAWSYLHPYDLDADEPFFVMPEANWLTSRIVHARRGATLARLERLIDAAGGHAAPPLAERVAALGSAPLPVVA
jgi:peptidoglycan-N-acetylglucosamine deacetylase